MLWYTLFAMAIMFVALPFVFSQETKKDKKNDFDRHVESTIGMYTPK